MTNRQRIDRELAKLSPMDRDMAWILYGYRRPAGFKGYLPATSQETAEFLGRKYKGKPFTERRVQQRMQSLLKMWKDRREAKELKDV